MPYMSSSMSFGAIAALRSHPEADTGNQQAAPEEKPPELTSEKNFVDVDTEKAKEPTREPIRIAGEFETPEVSDKSEKPSPNKSVVPLCTTTALTRFSAAKYVRSNIRFLHIN